MSNKKEAAPKAICRINVMMNAAGFAPIVRLVNSLIVPQIRDSSIPIRKYLWRNDDFRCKLTSNVRVLGWQYRTPQTHQIRGGKMQLFRSALAKDKKLWFLMAATVVLVMTNSSAGQTGGRNAGNKDTPEKKLQGYWKSTEAVIEFKTGRRITINEGEYDYAIIGSTIVVSNDEGSMEFPYKLTGEVLTVWVDMRKVTYTRMTPEEIEELQMSKRASGRNSGGGGNNGGGGTPQDLVGKWCYQANVQAQGGGRQSDICFTLKADGTYEYYGEASNSNPYGGSNSQSWDYGRWSATATTLTARSNSGQTKTYTLERRNHPRTGDPMLMVDGDAFVTYYQKRPW